MVQSIGQTREENEAKQRKESLTEDLDGRGGGHHVVLAIVVVSVCKAASHEPPLLEHSDLSQAAHRISYMPVVQGKRFPANVTAPLFLNSPSPRVSLCSFPLHSSSNTPTHLP